VQFSGALADMQLTRLENGMPECCARGCSWWSGHRERLIVFSTGTSARAERGFHVSDDIDEMGPIDYLVVEFPDTNKLTGEGFAQLVELVDRGIIRILDLAFVRKAADGSVAGVAIADLDGDGKLDLAVFEGASSGLIGDDDINEVGTILEPGSAAGILVYENVWAGPFAAALRRGGAEVVANGRIPVQQIIAALDAAEA
jgi:hypothetical protein